MIKAIVMSLIWWALVIWSGVKFDYKTAIFGILMSVYTAIMAAWLTSKIGREEENGDGGAE